MQRLVYDTETVGFHGMPVLLQYKLDNDEIKLHEFWRTPVQESLELIEFIMGCCNVGFNLAFDHFHLSKIYTTFLLCDPDWIPEDHIDEIAMLEPKARFGPCLKPASALDLMLVAKRGRYQSMMDRKDIKIRRVPDAIAYQLAEHLESTVEIDDIYFSRRKDKHSPRWSVRPSRGNPGFKDVILKFAASSALKVLAQHALKIPRSEILKFSDIEVDKKYRPKEAGWAPFALAIGKPGKWNKAWPEMIQAHIDHWAFNPRARQYGTSDVDYTDRLEAFFGHPEPGDMDSTLACMVASVRWRSYALDVPKVEEQMRVMRERIKETPCSPKVAKIYITEKMESVEAMQVTDTKKTTLQAIAKLKCDCTFSDIEIKDCPICHGTHMHPAAARADEVLDARQCKYRLGIYKKLKQALYRLHASYKVTGTLSNRMAGDNDLNVQGFERLKATRACFKLADDGYILGGGDFDSFEVMISAAMFNDENLTKVLTETYPCDCNKKTGSYNPDCDDCLGNGVTNKKAHGLFGMALSGLSYAEVMASKGSKDRDWYSLGKAGFLAMIYGGDWSTIVRKQNVEEEVAKAAYEQFERDFPGVKENRKLIIDMFCSMRQPEEGGKVYWHEPADKIESLLGFPRFFILENSICRALYHLAQNVPKDWKAIPGKVVRNQTKGKQTAAGAAMSALFGAAFGVQGNAMRAAANHRIQSTGAEITKKLQCNIYEIQPVGIHPWRVVPMNAHDEVMAPALPEYVEEVRRIVNETVESYRPLIPLIKMHWKTNLRDWSCK